MSSYATTVLLTALTALVTIVGIFAKAIAPSHPVLSEVLMNSAPVVAGALTAIAHISPSPKE